MKCLILYHACKIVIYRKVINIIINYSNLVFMQSKNFGQVGQVVVSNGVPCLQMRSVGSHSTSGREKEGKTE